ncbi:MAG TPA: hypothetical protein VHY08_18080, partial [Bacillota bacterium]|nr:hypothetical protein [Bacillota bacterium]
MADLKNYELIARARAVNKSHIDQNLLSQEVQTPTKELIQATKREELSVPVEAPGRGLEKQAPKTRVIEIPVPQTIRTSAPEPPAPAFPAFEPTPGWLPNPELLDELSLKVTQAIENSKLTAPQKTEATKLFHEVKYEIQKNSPDWDKVTGLLKKSLDY